MRRGATTLGGSGAPTLCPVSWASISPGEMIPSLPPSPAAFGREARDMWAKSDRAPVTLRKRAAKPAETINNSSHAASMRDTRTSQGRPHWFCQLRPTGRISVSSAVLHRLQSSGKEFVRESTAGTCGQTSIRIHRKTRLGTRQADRLGSAGRFGPRRRGWSEFRRKPQSHAHQQESHLPSSTPGKFLALDRTVNKRYISA